MSSKHRNPPLADNFIDNCILFKGALEGNELPQVLFLDLNMPHKSSFECLSEIKIRQKLKQISVILLFTSFDQDILNRLFNNGLQDYIRKPAEFPLLKKVIQYTLTLIARARDGKWFCYLDIIK